MTIKHKMYLTKLSFQSLSLLLKIDSEQLVQSVSDFELNYFKLKIEIGL